MDKEYVVMYAKNLEGQWKVHSTFSSQEEAERFIDVSDAIVEYQFWKIEQVWSWPF